MILYIYRLMEDFFKECTSALVAVVEALRMNPDRYAVIYNSKYDNNNDNIFESSASTIAVAISASTKLPQNYYYNEYHEGILEIANSLLKILTNQIVDKTMVAAVREKRACVQIPWDFLLPSYLFVSFLEIGLVSKQESLLQMNHCLWP